MNSDEHEIISKIKQMLGQKYTPEYIDLIARLRLERWKVNTIGNSIYFSNGYNMAFLNMPNMVWTFKYGKLSDFEPYMEYQDLFKRLEIHSMSDISRISEFKDITILWINDMLWNKVPPELKRMKTIKGISFSSMIQLEPWEVDDEDNPAEDVELKLKDIFKSLNKLTAIKIYYCHEGDKAFHAAIAHKKTERLIAQNSWIDEIPQHINNLKKLTRLSVKNNNINRIPDTIGDLERLQQMDLSENPISELPDTFSRLKNLEVLDLGRTNFKEFPKQIIELENLKKLRISDTVIEEIPPQIGRLQKLEILRLQENNLREIPKEIGNLKNLRELNLWNNKRYTVPETIKRLPKLKSLKIREYS